MAEDGQAPQRQSSHLAAGSRQDMCRSVLAEPGSSPYRVLGLREGDSLAAAQAAWRKLKAQLHPDKNLSAPDELRRGLEEASQRVDAAWEELRPGHEVMQKNAEAAQLWEATERARANWETLFLGVGVDGPLNGALRRLATYRRAVRRWSLVASLVAEGDRDRRRSAAGVEAKGIARRMRRWKRVTLGALECEEERAAEEKRRAEEEARRESVEEGAEELIERAVSKVFGGGKLVSTFLKHFVSGWSPAGRRRVRLEEVLEKIKRQGEHTERENSRVMAENYELKCHIDNVTKVNCLFERKHDELAKDRGHLERRMDHLQTQNDDLRAKAAALGQEVDARERQLQELGEAKTELEKEVEEWRVWVEKAQKRMSDLEGTQAGLMGELDKEKALSGMLARQKAILEGDVAHLTKLCEGMKHV
mmetsp:Transcript_45984/g.115311  ORF Transcript_45984/g.115311 Transcript_45984/m.115311 type:complete len:420 (+) Transcript_45984:341-1600(+)